MSDHPLPSVADCERIFHAAMEQGDAKGVEAALLVMAVQDPHRASHLLETTRIALALADRIHEKETT